MERELKIVRGAVFRHQAVDALSRLTANDADRTVLEDVVPVLSVTQSITHALSSQELIQLMAFTPK